MEAKPHIRRNEIELMAPAGSWESLHAALAAGADAVYFGVGELNMRARSSFNFMPDDLGRIVGTAHKADVRAYLTLNTILYDNDLDDMRRTLDRARSVGVDAVIVSDQAAILYARTLGLEVHISTQLNLSNLESVAFYARWADVVVLARELDLYQIGAIADGIRERDIRGPGGELVRIEMFAHGALCMAVSGKCYLSLHDNGHSANRGACRQICRRTFELRDRETGEEMAVENPFILSPKDLCTIDFLDRFVGSGVRVLKIEGRARPGEYVKRVVECYDEALRALEAGGYTSERTAAWIARLGEVFNRGFWGGYYLGAPRVQWSGVYGSAATRRKIYVGKVTNFFKKVSVAEVLVEASPLDAGQTCFFMGETTGVLEFTAETIRVNAQPVRRTVQGETCSLSVPALVRRGDKLYKFIDPSGSRP